MKTVIEGYMGVVWGNDSGPTIVVAQGEYDDYKHACIESGPTGTVPEIAWFTGNDREVKMNPYKKHNEWKRPNDEKRIKEAYALELKPEFKPGQKYRITIEEI